MISDLKVSSLEAFAVAMPLVDVFTSSHSENGVGVDGRLIAAAALCIIDYSGATALVTLCSAELELHVT